MLLPFYQTFKINSRDYTHVDLLILRPNHHDKSKLYPTFSKSSHESDNTYDDAKKIYIRFQPFNLVNPI